MHRGDQARVFWDQVEHVINLKGLASEMQEQLTELLLRKPITVGLSVFGNSPP